VSQGKKKRNESRKKEKTQHELCSWEDWTMYSGYNHFICLKVKKKKKKNKFQFPYVIANDLFWFTFLSFFFFGPNNLTFILF
jgi:hypothetical protein